MPKVIFQNSKQTQVSWLQGHYLFCTISSFQVVFSGFHGESKAGRKDKRYRRGMAHLTLTDMCIMLIATYSLDSMEFFFCRSACLGFFLLLSLRDESVTPNPRLAFSLIDYFLPRLPQHMSLNLSLPVGHKITQNSYKSHF